MFFLPSVVYDAIVVGWGHIGKVRPIMKVIVALIIELCSCWVYFVWLLLPYLLHSS